MVAKQTLELYLKYSYPTLQLLKNLTFLCEYKIWDKTAASQMQMIVKP